jgi:aldehyde:ferredoxin oxidoreductase
LGIKALIIEGLPEQNTFYGLHVDKNGIVIKEEPELVGKGNYEVVKTLIEKLGKKIGTMSKALPSAVFWKSLILIRRTWGYC